MPTASGHADCMARLRRDSVKAVGLGAALLMASLGNITAAHSTSGGRSVMVFNAWGILCGTLIVPGIALLLHCHCG